MGKVVVASFIILLVGACRTKPADGLSGFECDAATKVCVPRDAGTEDRNGGGGVGGLSQPVGDAGTGGVGGGPPADAGSGADAAGGAPAPLPALRISPAGPVFTNATVAIDVTVSSPPTLDEVVLLKGGTPIATWSAPPYQFSWDTTAEPEGSYEITARGRLGDRTVTSLAVSVVVDRTAPQIAMIVPAPGATKVVLSDYLEISFNEPLDPSSVATDAITLTAADIPVPTTTVLSADGLTLRATISDRSRIVFPATVFEGVSTGLKDRAGNRLARVSEWSWIAPQWVQMPTLPVAAAGELAGRTSLALGEHGRPLLAFVSREPERRATIARYSPGATWDLSIPSPAQPVDAVALAAHAGMPVVAWSSDRTNVARWAGTAWERPYGAALPDENITGLVVGLALDPAGAPVVAWNSRATTTTEAIAYLARWISPGWMRLGTAGVAVGRAVLRVDGNGTPAVFTGNPGTEAARLHRYADGMWQSIDIHDPVLVGATGAAAAFAFDHRNRLVVAIKDPAAGARRISMRYLDGTGWQPVADPIVTDADISEVVFLIDGAGNPTVAWTQTNELRDGDVRVDRFLNGLWRGGYGVLGTGYALSLIVDAAGAPVVSWTTNQMAAMARANR